MGSRKTIDGILLQSIAKMAQQQGIGVRQGSRHAYVLSATGQRACPLASSTHARRMIVPWMARQLEAYTPTEIYHCLKQGYWR